MKKALSICIMLLIAGAASAQHINFGFRGRYTVAHLHGSDNNTSGTSSSLNNVDVGIFPELDYGKVVFQPGLAYVVKGGVGSGALYIPNSLLSSFVTQVALNYIELPLNVLYKIPFKPGKVLLGGGPYFAYAANGSLTTYSTTMDAKGNTVSKDDKQKTNIPFGSGTNSWKRFDYGINLLATFRFNNGIDAGLGTGFGLANITNTQNQKLRNQTFSVSLGYFFQ